VTATPVKAYIGLGSNLGDRAATLKQALELLDRLPGTRLVESSNFYETEAVGGVATQAFLNGAACIETTLDPRELMKALLAVEAELGRVRGEKWGDRTCDLDLLLYGDITVDEPDLTVPHPEIANRKFVLVPLSQIAPDLVIPRKKKKIQDMVADLEDPHWIKRFSEKSS
jgi:2-amino-4-hydroxy-6-hydroxymethyldihydropteridine diphosphokinase